jgi:hypothetical protein
MALSFIDKHGSIKRSDVMELCRISKDQAYKLLYRLKKNEQVVQRGELKKVFMSASVNLCASAYINALWPVVF